MIHSKMLSAAECRPFCLWVNEIRYQYVDYRQKLGIYIYVYIYIHIRLSVNIKQGGGGGGGLSLWRLHGTTGRCHNDTVPQATT